MVGGFSLPTLEFPPPPLSRAVVFKGISLVFSPFLCNLGEGLLASKREQLSPAGT